MAFGKTMFLSQTGWAIHFHDLVRSVLLFASVGPRASAGAEAPCHGSFMEELVLECEHKTWDEGEPLGRQKRRKTLKDRWHLVHT